LASCALISSSATQASALVAAGVIAPGFKPLARLGLGLVLRQRGVVLRALRSLLVGYLLLVAAGAATMLVIKATGSDEPTNKRCCDAQEGACSARRGWFSTGSASRWISRLTPSLGDCGGSLGASSSDEYDALPLQRGRAAEEWAGRNRETSGKRPKSLLLCAMLRDRHAARTALWVRLVCRR
jgi:hypothetical protein